jgi:3-oxoacyl-(acyl-carrier-protein) synthase
MTGVGLVTPLGATAAETLRAWQAGAVAERRPLPALAGTALAGAEAAAPPEFDPAGRLGGRRMLKYMSAAAVLGCVAAREALHEAAALARFAPERIGLYAATGLAAASVDEIQGMLEASIDESGEFSELLLGQRGLAATNPLLSFKILANMPPCLISIMEGLKGPSLILTPWEGQTGAALLEAWQAVREGAVDCALAGAADSAAHPATLVYLHQAGLLAEGEAPASGAGYVVLERAATARRDGRRALAVVEAITLEADEDGMTADPLAARMGRLFAAAPAVALGLAAASGGGEFKIGGVEGQRLAVRLRRVS